jgi:hypothetical protein
LLLTVPHPGDRICRQDQQSIFRVISYFNY